MSSAGDKAGKVSWLTDFINLVVKTDFPDIRKIAAIHSARLVSSRFLTATSSHFHFANSINFLILSQGSAYVFPRENNIDNQPMIRLYTQVNMLNGQKSTMDPQEMRWKVTAEDIMDADKRVSEASYYFSDNGL